MSLAQFSRKCCLMQAQFSIRRSQFISYRCLSQNPKENSGEQQKSWALQKVERFVEGYEKALERRLPKVHKGYMFIKKGVVDLKEDIKIYCRLQFDLSIGKRDLSQLAYRELVLYREARKYVAKAGGILFLAIIPFGIYVLALMALFPKRFLTPHFLSRKQREEVLLKKHIKKVQSFTVSLSHMDLIVHKINQQYLTDEYLKLREVLLKRGRRTAAYDYNSLEPLAQLEKQEAPSAEEIVQCKYLFGGEPFGMLSDYAFLFYFLGRCWDTRIWLLKKARIKDCMVILLMDQALLSMGIENLTDEAIIEACFIRGRYPFDSSREERIEFLKEWTKISQLLRFDIQEVPDILSILMYSAVLMNYTHKESQRFIPPHEKKDYWPCGTSFFPNTVK